MSKPSPITLTVTQTSTITPNMQRITLSGEGLSKYPTECAGGYIKLLFSPLGTTDLSQLNDGERPTMRTYTIRQYNPVENWIEVDFVRHITTDLQCGFAARWAMNAKVGDTVSVAGPGLIQGLNLESDWFFLVADMTSLPALSAKVKSLPEHAVGHAVIQINSTADKQTLEAPQGIKVTWLIEDETEETLSQTVRNLEWLDGQVSIWTACEFESMRELRQYFRNEKSRERQHLHQQLLETWRH